MTRLEQVSLDRQWEPQGAESFGTNWGHGEHAFDYDRRPKNTFRR